MTSWNDRNRHYNSVADFYEHRAKQGVLGGNELTGTERATIRAYAATLRGQADRPLDVLENEDGGGIYVDAYRKVEE